MDTFALQVYEPESYQGTQDADLLETVYLAYIPTGQVDKLAQQLLVKSSAFYTALGAPYDELAAHVVPTFSVDAVSSGPGNSPPASPGVTSADDQSSSSSKTR